MKLCLKKVISLVELAEIDRCFREFVLHYERCEILILMRFQGNFLILILLGNISRTILITFRQHSFLTITYCTLQLQSATLGQHGQHGNIQWKDYVECYCLLCTLVCILIQTFRTKLLCGPGFHIFNTTVK